MQIPKKKEKEKENENKSNKTKQNILASLHVWAKLSICSGNKSVPV